MVDVNGAGIAVDAPFGGFKHSGIGRSRQRRINWIFRSKVCRGLELINRLGLNTF